MNHAGKPFEKTNKLAKSATWVNVGGTVGFLVLAIVSGALHIKVLLISFVILAVLCAAVGFALMLGAARRNKAAIDSIVKEAEAAQQRRMNG